MKEYNSFSSEENTLEKATLIAANAGKNNKPNSYLSVDETLNISNQIQINNEDIHSIVKSERYKIMELIGQGGMGKVYKAQDLMLKRYVALKFLRSDTRDLVSRFLQEARAQARIEHKNICKVYEVGQKDGHFFIAMQYISGLSLKEAKKQMSLEQKVYVIKDVAEALHHAHKLGLIHRDIKPANIMLEKLDDGSWQAYVMDFGLVKEIAADGNTLTGVVMGTPAFMPPEQAKGEIHRIDRRTDVYSLGATLYDLLVDQPPFSTTLGSNIFIDIVEKDVEPLRKRDNTIPIDIETIVMKCLEKEPQHRYDSAKALSEDLQRYLDGVPIQGRPTSGFYKLQKYARKNLALVSVSMAAFVIIISISTLWIVSMVRERERAHAAQQFGQEIEKSDNIMRIAYLLPLHNTEQDRMLVKGHIQKIEQQIKEMGAFSEVSGNYAIGRGYFALHEYHLALSYFEKSWKQGYRNSEIAYDIAQALSELYKQARAEAQMNSNGEMRELKIKEAIKQYRDPSIDYLKTISVKEVESPAYVEALLAFDEERYSEALSKAEQAYNQTQALYEAKKLQGDIYLISASDEFNKGQYDKANKDLLLAGELFHNALEIAHSDTSLYISESERLTLLLSILKEQGKPIDEIFNQAIEACDKAIVTNPQSYEAYRKKAELLWRKGERLIDESKDPLPNLLKAIEMGQIAVKFNPKDYKAIVAVGIAMQLKGDYETSKGANPLNSFDNAVNYYKQALLINPNYVNAYMEMGNTYWFKGNYENTYGLEPTESVNKAIENYQKAISYSNNLSIVYDNAGIAYLLKAKVEYGKGKDPRSSIEEAIKLHSKAIELNQNRSNSYNNLALAFSQMADYQVSKGIDPRLSNKKAIELYEVAIKINPSMTSLNVNIGSAYLSNAKYEDMVGQDPLPSFNKALESFLHALENNTNNFSVLSSISTAQTTLAEFMLKKDLTVNKYLDDAIRYSNQGIKLNPNYFYFYNTLANVYLLKAKLVIKSGKSPEILFNNALSLFQKSISLNSKAYVSYSYYAKCFYEKASWLIKEKKTAKDEILQGLELIDKALSIKVDNDAELYIIKGKILLLAAENKIFPEQSSLQVNEALKNLNKAVEINPLMKKECLQSITLAQKLITP